MGNTDLIQIQLSSLQCRFVVAMLGKELPDKNSLYAN